MNTRTRPRAWCGEQVAEPLQVELAGLRVIVWMRNARSRGGVPGEDALGAWSVGQTDLVAVADGVGGSAGGGKASGELMRALAKLNDEQVAGLGPRGSVLNAIEAAHRRIRRRVPGAGSTAIVATITQSHLRLFNTGDSGAGLVSRDGSIRHTTLGHGPAQYAIEAGELDHDKLLEHKEHHIVTNVVGMDPLTIDSTSELTLRKRDTLVLASDGVLDNLSWERIASLVSGGRLASCATHLAAAVEAELDAGGKDDDRCFLLARRR